MDRCVPEQQFNLPFVTQPACKWRETDVKLCDGLKLHARCIRVVDTLRFDEVDAKIRTLLKCDAVMGMGIEHVVCQPFAKPNQGNPNFMMYFAAAEMWFNANPNANYSPIRDIFYSCVQRFSRSNKARGIPERNADHLLMFPFRGDCPITPEVDQAHVLALGMSNDGTPNGMQNSGSEPVQVGTTIHAGIGCMLLVGNMSLLPTSLQGGVFGNSIVSNVEMALYDPIVERYPLNMSTETTGIAAFVAHQCNASNVRFEQGIDSWCTHAPFTGNIVTKNVVNPGEMFLLVRETDSHSMLLGHCETRKLATRSGLDSMALNAMLMHAVLNTPMGQCIHPLWQLYQPPRENKQMQQIEKETHCVRFEKKPPIVHVADIFESGDGLDPTQQTSSRTWEPGPSYLAYAASVTLAQEQDDRYASDKSCESIESISLAQVA